MSYIDLVIKKLEGRLTEQEEIEFQGWLSESEQNSLFFQKLTTLKKEGGAYHLYQKIDVEAAWEQVLQKKQKAQVPQSTAPVRATRTRSFPLRFRVAAAIAFLVGTAALFYFLQLIPGKVHITTAYGEKTTFVLPDESEVVLNANSRLWYKKNQPRIVWLEGEAFFNVRKKPLTNEKFRVITKDLEVEVLGTAFNVNSHQEQTKVYLEEGSVKLDLQNEAIPEILLVPGEMLTFSAKEGEDFEKTQLKSNLESSWKAGIQLFEKAPLYEILIKIEDIYGVSIELQDSKIAEIEMTMGIPVEDLSIALETIETVTELNMTKINHNTFVLE